MPSEIRVFQCPDVSQHCLMVIEVRVRRHPLTSINFFYARALYGISANFLTLTSSSILIFITSKAGLPPFLLLFYTIIIFLTKSVPS